MGFFEVFERLVLYKERVIEIIFMIGIISIIGVTIVPVLFACGYGANEDIYYIIALILGAVSGLGLTISAFILTVLIAHSTAVLEKRK